MTKIIYQWSKLPIHSPGYKIAKYRKALVPPPPEESSNGDTQAKDSTPTDAVTTQEFA